MIKRTALATLCLMVPSLSLAQGNDSATSAGSGGNGTATRFEVQVGAGSNGDVTTGSSGPDAQAGGGNPDRVEPVDGGFSLRPDHDPFFGPAMLAVTAVPSSRCDLIGHQPTRERCLGTVSQ